MYTLGIDVGSASSKAVILEDGKRVAASAVIQSGTGTSGPGRVLELVFDGTSYIPKKYLNDYFAAPNKMKELYDGTLTLLNYLVSEEELTKKEEKAIEKAIDIVKDFREEYLDSQLTGCDLDSLEENHQLTEEWREIIQNTKA